MKSNNGKFQGFDKVYRKALQYPLYKAVLLVTGALIAPILFAYMFYEKAKTGSRHYRQRVLEALEKDDAYNAILEREKAKCTRKYAYFKKAIDTTAFTKEVEKRANAVYQRKCSDGVTDLMKADGEKPNTLPNAFSHLYANPIFKIFSYVLAFPMYMVLAIFFNPYLKYIFERVTMLFFVIFGVTLVVFTILYFSPMDPARNILGELATEEQVADWKALYGMNDPYYKQALRAVKNVVTFDFGSSFVGNEPVMESIMRKFPITLKVTLASLLVSVLIAVPAGIISAIKQYSTFDFSAMTLALIGISIPNFWLGLMLILVFSVNLGWLNVIYDNTSLKSLIMPAIVLGTALAASVARMTRSSMLEVIKSDYITTARAKGLKESKVILGHALRNAIIPIITIIGLQFGGMLGGSAVTERVFTIPGIGSYIVSKQMIPDIPVVLAGVVYIAIVISIANLVIDIMYAFFDPRIKAKLKRY